VTKSKSDRTDEKDQLIALVRRDEIAYLKGKALRAPTAKGEDRPPAQRDENFLAQDPPFASR